MDSEEIGDPYDWVDRYVEVTGHVTKRDGLSFIEPVDIREDEGDRFAEAGPSHYYDADEEWGIVEDDWDRETELY